MIFDTHTHAYWSGLSGAKQDLRARMRAEGVERSVQIGTSWETSQKALELARDWGAGTWCSAGWHPTGCQDLPAASAREWMDRFETLIRTNPDKIVAVGETGLDYFHTAQGRQPAQRRTQQAFFRAHAELALRLDLPVVIHTRDARDDTLGLIKDCGLKRGVVHSFSENPAFAQDLLSWSDGFYISFSGILTYKRSLEVQETARILRLDRILLETDAPFLVPQSLRGSCTLNEPAFVRQVLDCLESLRPEPAETVERAVWENSHRFYRVGAPSDC